MNNNGYGTIAGLQMAHYELTYGTMFPGEIGDRVPDYAAIARAYGADGVTIERADDFLPRSRPPSHPADRRCSTSR